MSWGAPVPADPSTFVKDSPEWIAHRDSLLGKWEAAKTTLAAAKESEAEARIAFGDFAFPVAERKSGVNKLELNNGFVAKLGHKINHKVIASNDAIEKAEDSMKELGNEAGFLFERILQIEYKFSVGEYNKLAPELSLHADVKAVIDTLIETSIGLPSLEIVAPKAKLNG
jgi:hypothetical protein